MQVDSQAQLKRLGFFVCLHFTKEEKMSYRRTCIELWLLAGILFLLSLAMNPHTAVFVDLAVLMLFGGIAQTQTQNE